MLSCGGRTLCLAVVTRANPSRSAPCLTWDCCAPPNRTGRPILGRPLVWHLASMLTFGPCGSQSGGAPQHDSNTACAPLLSRHSPWRRNRSSANGSSCSASRVAASRAAGRAVAATAGRAGPAGRRSARVLGARHRRSAFPLRSQCHLVVTAAVTQGLESCDRAVLLLHDRS